MPESIFPVIPVVTPPAADAIAAGLLREIEAEAARRIGQHIDWWRAFWESNEATPEQIAASMSSSATLFFAIAAANKNHIAAVAQILGKTPEEWGIPAECMSTPVPVTPHNDGTVTIG